MAEFFGNDYARRREEIYGPLRRQGVFTWDAMYGEEYALASVLPISGAFRAELKRASEELGQIFAKTATVVMQAGDELPAVGVLGRHGFTHLRGWNSYPSYRHEPPSARSGNAL